MRWGQLFHVTWRVAYFYYTLNIRNFSLGSAMCLNSALGIDSDKKVHVNIVFNCQTYTYFLVEGRTSATAQDIR